MHIIEKEKSALCTKLCFKKEIEVLMNRRIKCFLSINVAHIYLSSYLINCGMRNSLNR